MIKKLPFILLLMLSLCTTAQTETVTIDWSFDSTPTATGNANASRTIEVGDTVTWNWYASGTHNVKSNASANESFESDFFGNGGTFSHTFTSIGTNDYVCQPHPTTMFGTITVVAEGVLNLASFDTLGTINMYPNPTDSDLTIDFNIQNIEKLNIKVFNLLGKEVFAKQISKNDTFLMLSNLKNGVYLVRITSLTGENSTTRRFVKL
jgi:plastocyanin